MTLEETTKYAAEARQRVIHRSDYQSSNQFAAAARRADDLVAVNNILSAEIERWKPAVINILSKRKRKNGTAG